MLDNLETLITLSRTGTMRETATALGISQSAVSKRIAALERHYGQSLTERQGRRVALTPQGNRLTEQAAALVSELRGLALEAETQHRRRIILGVSEAILASWGPALFAAVSARMPHVQLSFHAQRSPVVLDRLRSGEYMVGICTGYADAEADLRSEIIVREPMVIIPAALETWQPQPDEAINVLTIESRSGAWASIEEDMRRLNLHRNASLESFFSVAQMALAGFGHGLVPMGVARTLGIDAKLLIPVHRQGLHRPVRFVARKSMFSRPVVRNFYQAIVAEAGQFV